MSVEYWYTDDSFCRAEQELRRAIGQYARRNSYIYIGLTQQKPIKRFNKHQQKWAVGHKWDRMIVIYHARSFTLMQYVEDRLITYAKNKYGLDKVLNERDSQIPKVSFSPNGYWIYILVQA